MRSINLYDDDNTDTNNNNINVPILISMKQKNNDIPSLITKDEKYINDPVSVANTLNNFFTSVAVHSKIKFSNKSFRNFL